MKIIAFIAAILSAATVATLTFTTVPSIQKQAADNAAAIEQNAAEIERLQTGEKYLHKLTFGTYKIVCYVKNNDNTPFNDTTLTQYINNLPEKCLLNYYASTITNTETGTDNNSLPVYLVAKSSGGSKYIAGCIQVGGSSSSNYLNFSLLNIYSSVTDTVSEI